MKSFRIGLLMAAGSIGIFWGSAAYSQAQGGTAAGQGDPAIPRATPTPSSAQPSDAGGVHETVIIGAPYYVTPEHPVTQEELQEEDLVVPRRC